MTEVCSLEKPLVVGRYALYARLASGGMASVYAGRLLGRGGFRRTVAIKRLHEQFASDIDFRSMLMDEGQIAARIRHANVVPMLDVVALQNELFLVMEYVDGESVASLRRAVGLSPLPPAIVAAIICDALEGLHAAHEAKADDGQSLDIVHRDVSPQNLLVGTDGVTRVFDFGIAKAARRLTGTRNGEVKGKLAYMSPEQVHGAAVTRTTDVFAAGIVLWELLTGRRLFAGDSDANTLQRLLMAEVEPPSRAVASLPPALDAVVLKALAKEPDQRFATALEMARALEDAIAPAPRRKVAEWLRTVAGPRLDERAQVIREIETASSTLSDPPQHTAPPRAGAPAESALPSARASSAPTQTHSLTAATKSGSLVIADSAASRRGRVMLMAGLGLVVLGAAAAGFVGMNRTTTAAAPATAPPPTTTASAPAVDSSAVILAAAPPATTTATPPAPTAPPPAASTSKSGRALTSVAPVTPKTLVHPKTAPAPAPPVASSPAAATTQPPIYSRE